MGLFSRVGLFLRDYGIRILACTQCPYLKVTFSDQITSLSVSTLDPSAATVEIIDTTQQEMVIINPAECAAIEM